jgi:hypothetical protein
MSQALVPCTVKGPSIEDEDRPTGTVMAEPIGSLTPATRVPATLVEMDGEVLIPITNFGTRTLHIGSDTPLAALENFDSMQEIPSSPEVTAGVTMETLGRDLPGHLQSLFKRSVVDLPDAADRIAIHGMLADFADVFRSQWSASTYCGRTHPPVKQRAYRMSEEGNRIVDKECQKMLEKGVIKESNSLWSSPVVLVAKKNGEVRFCVDYRRLNSLTRKDSYPLPNVYETLGALGGCKYFCTMDLASGFWQIPMAEEDSCKTAFPTRTSLYEFRTMPFGLCNAPATFERIMGSASWFKLDFVSNIH